MALARDHQDVVRFSRFQRGVAMIYKGGGAVGRSIGGHLSNQDIPLHHQHPRHLQVR